MKKNNSFEAFDDGHFPHHYKGGKGSTYIVGVLTEGASKVLKVAWCTVRVDMNTSTEAILDMSKMLGGDVVILDGVTYAGFDVVDPNVISEQTGKSVIVVIQHPLNLDRIEKALKKHFPDWGSRLAVIRKVYLNSDYVETPWRTLRIYTVGLSVEAVRGILSNLCLYSPVPEPLRIADKLASALSRLNPQVQE